MHIIAEKPDIDPELQFSSQVLRDLSRYWHAARADREMPSRADIDPTRMPPALLPHILLVDVEYRPERRFRWRLIGTHVTTNLRRDSTGAYWDELYGREALSSLEFRADWVLRRRAPLRSVGRVTPVAQRYGDVEAFIAPLSPDGDTVDCILMGADYKLPR